MVQDLAVQLTNFHSATCSLWPCVWMLSEQPHVLYDTELA